MADTVSVMPWGERRLRVALAFAATVLGGIVLLSWATPGAAQTSPSSTTSTTISAEDAALLADGAAVFSRACTGCHQVGGVGIEGQFPPLRDNPNVAGQADYVEQVVRNGRQGEIVVNDVTYNGVMPVVGASLTDDEIAAVVAYVAGGLTLPPGVAAPEVPGMPGPPGQSLLLIAVGFLVAGVAAAFVLGPLVLARTDRLHLSWVDAALKAFVIVVYFVVAIVLVPGRVMELEAVTKLSQDAQYVLGSVVWGGGLVIGVAGLWWAGRKGLL